MSGGATFGYSKIPTYTVRTEDDVAQGVKHVHVTIVDTDSMEIEELKLASVVDSSKLPLDPVPFTFMVPLPDRGQAYTLRVAEMVVTSDYNNLMRDVTSGFYILRPPSFNIECQNPLSEASIMFSPFDSTTVNNAMIQSKVPLNNSIPGCVPTPFGSYVTRNAAWAPMQLTDSSQTYNALLPGSPNSYASINVRGFEMRYIMSSGRMIKATAPTPGEIRAAGSCTIVLHFEFRPLTQTLVR